MNKKSVSTDMPLKEILFDKESPTEGDYKSIVRCLETPGDVPIVGKDDTVGIWSHRKYESNSINRKSDKIMVLVLGKDGSENLGSILTNKTDTEKQIQTYLNRLIGTKLIQDFQNSITHITALEKNAIEIECKFVSEPKQLQYSIDPEKYFSVSIIDCSDEEDDFGDALCDVFSGCSVPILHNFSHSFSERIKQMDSESQKNMACMMSLVDKHTDFEDQLHILLSNLYIFFDKDFDNLPEFCRQTMQQLHYQYNDSSSSLESRIKMLRRSVNLISMGETDFSPEVKEQRRLHKQAIGVVDSRVKPLSMKQKHQIRAGKDAWYQECIDDLANAHSDMELKEDVESLCGIIQKAKEELKTINNDWELFDNQPIGYYIEKWRTVTKGNLDPNVIKQQVYSKGGEGNHTSRNVYGHDAFGYELRTRILEKGLIGKLGNSNRPAMNLHPKFWELNKLIYQLADLSGGYQSQGGFLQLRGLEQNLKSLLSKLQNNHVEKWFSKVLLSENLLKLKIEGGWVA